MAVIVFGDKRLWTERTLTFMAGEKAGSLSSYRLSRNSPGADSVATIAVVDVWWIRRTTNSRFYRPPGIATSTACPIRVLRTRMACAHIDVRVQKQYVRHCAVEISIPCITYARLERPWTFAVRIWPTNRWSNAPESTRFQLKRARSSYDLPVRFRTSPPTGFRRVRIIAAGQLPRPLTCLRTRFP